MINVFSPGKLCPVKCKEKNTFLTSYRFLWHAENKAAQLDLQCYKGHKQMYVIR